MAHLLEEEYWADLCDWTDNLPAQGHLMVSDDTPHVVGRIEIWLFDKPRDCIIPATPTYPTYPAALPSVVPAARSSVVPAALPSVVPRTATPTGVENTPLGSPSKDTRKELPLHDASRKTTDIPGIQSFPSSFPQVRAVAGPQVRPQVRSQASAGQSFRRQFRPLTKDEMSRLSEDKNDSLWPKPDWINGDWPSQTTYGITLLLSRALGYLAGCGPISDERLSTYRWNVKLPFKVPVKIELNDEYHGDAIMYGLRSPSANLNGSRQHWSAGHYIFHNPEGEMGAIIEIPDGVHTPESIDNCEIQALTILLDRQTTYFGRKRRLSAWLISIKPGYFRVLEAYLDQNINPFRFHFSIVDECKWEKGETKNLDGSDEEYKWLLSWALAQLEYY